MPWSAVSKRPSAHHRARERAFFVAEQLVFDQGFRQIHARKRHKRSRAAPAKLMDCARQQLFSRAGLAGNQHVHIARRDLLHQREHFLHHPRCSQQLMQPSGARRSRAQALHFLLCRVEFVRAF